MNLEYFAFNKILLFCFLLPLNLPFSSKRAKYVSEFILNLSSTVLNNTKKVMAAFSESTNTV